MNFNQLVRGRVSIRSYDRDRKVPDEVLKRILEAGRLAPSAANRQPWQFLLISSQTMLAAVRPCYSGAWFHDAPHILVVKGDRRVAWSRATDGYNSLEIDVTIAMDHLILAAESEGLGTCWIAAFDPAILYSALGLKGTEEIFAITPIGYPPEGFVRNAEKSRKSFDEVVRFL